MTRRDDGLSRTVGLSRSIKLFEAFRVEQSDPDRFYRFQAADTVEWIRRWLDLELSGARVIDVGGGAGYFTEAFRSAGADCFLVEPTAAAPLPTPCGSSPESRHRHAVHPARLAQGTAVAGDGRGLPFATGCADLTFSSNVLEHVADPHRCVDELARVTRLGGLVYLSFTAWYSLWGGHETAPWHYLGGHRAARRYERVHGRPPGNEFGRSLFARHVGPTLRWLRDHPDLTVVHALPRYHPRWLHWVVRVPGLREVLTWNLLVVLRRTPR